MMCYESSEHKFDVWFDDMGNSHPEWKEQLEQESKEKWTFSYDRGHQYDNIITNLSESFNHMFERCM